MSVDPYKAGMLKDNTYFAKTVVEGRLVVVLQCTLDNRALRLIVPQSRAVRRHEVHELIMTDEPGAAPGREVNRVGYLGFVEILDGGVIIKGDEVLLDGELIGHIAGFDETHRIEGVVFENVQAGGRKWTRLEDGPIRMKFATGVEFR